VPASIGKWQLLGVSTEANRSRQGSILSGELQRLESSREHSPKLNHSLERAILFGIALNHLPLGLLSAAAVGQRGGFCEADCSPEGWTNPLTLSLRRDGHTITERLTNWGAPSHAGTDALQQPLQEKKIHGEGV